MSPNRCGSGCDIVIRTPKTSGCAWPSAGGLLAVHIRKMTPSQAERQSRHAIKWPSHPQRGGYKPVYIQALAAASIETFPMALAGRFGQKPPSRSRIAGADATRTCSNCQRLTLLIRREGRSRPVRVVSGIDLEKHKNKRKGGLCPKSRKHRVRQA